MNDLLDLINQLLVFMFTGIRTFLSTYYFIVVTFFVIAVVLVALRYISKNINRVAQ